MSSKQRVLFVCIHNSARSQMAESFLNELGHAHFEAESAGIEPGILNPHVIEVMKESGIDLTGKATRSVSDLFASGVAFDRVITVCDRQAAEKCPVFPGEGKRLAWSFTDPSGFRGTRDDILQQTRIVRDEIKNQVLHFIHQEKEA